MSKIKIFENEKCIIYVLKNKFNKKDHITFSLKFKDLKGYVALENHYEYVIDKVINNDHRKKTIKTIDYLYEILKNEFNNG